MAMPKGRLAAALFALSLLHAPAVRAADAPVAVVELFTSQGCSSCPPADRLMGEYSSRDDVIVLSLPVDYWDYLGWKDTLASSENSARQRAYAESRGDRAVYTPQAVINGRRHVVGSNASAIQTAIRTGGGLPLPVETRLSKDALTIHIGAGRTGSDAPEGKMATVWLVLYDRETQVPIQRGENRGRTVSYHNVVRKMQAIGMWKHKATEIELPRSEIVKSGAESCAVLVQVENDGRPGPIIGAAYLGEKLM